MRRPLPVREFAVPAWYSLASGRQLLHEPPATACACIRIRGRSLLGRTVRCGEAHFSSDARELTFDMSGMTRLAGACLLDGGVMPHSHRRTLPLYAAYSGPKSEDNARSSGLIWNWLM